MSDFDDFYKYNGPQVYQERADRQARKEENIRVAQERADRTRASTTYPGSGKDGNWGPVKGEPIKLGFRDSVIVFVFAIVFCALLFCLFLLPFKFFGAF